MYFLVTLLFRDSTNELEFLRKGELWGKIAEKRVKICVELKGDLDKAASCLVSLELLI